MLPTAYTTLDMYDVGKKKHLIHVPSTKWRDFWIWVQEKGFYKFPCSAMTDFFIIAHYHILSITVVNALLGCQTRCLDGDC